MATKHYSLFSGRVLDRKAEPDGRTPHYQILVSGGDELFRVAVNTRSGASGGQRSELLYFADDDFRHDITTRLASVADGLLDVPTQPGGLALDYQRGGMFDRRHMRRISPNRPGPRNDLIDELEYWVGSAIADPDTRVHAFGTRWGPEEHAPDQVFGFIPGNGIHDVHMNQGNRDEHRHDNGIWADGGLLFHQRGSDRWCAILLAFQTQSWHTDERGNPILGRQTANREESGDLRKKPPPASIVAAFVHPNEEKDGVEHVTIRNPGDGTLDVSGWQVQNRQRDAMTLNGLIPARRARRFPLPASVPLSARGGLLRLIDNEGVEVDGVTYTRQETRAKRGSLTF